MRPGPPQRLFLLALFLPTLALLAALPLLSAWTGAPVSQFTRDVFSIAEIPVWSGLVSNLGLMLWTATVAVCGLAATVAETSARERTALAGAAALSLVLLVDDALLVHEFIAPDRLGIPETVVVGCYVALTGAWLIAFRGEVLGRRRGLLLVAGALFAVSIGMDWIEPDEAEWWRYWLEESAKLLGIVGWFGYLTLFSVDALRSGSRS